MGFPGILQKLFSNGGKGGTLRPEIVPDIEPRGVVKMWYGDASAVPRGWAICDGTQGTPDLRDSFIIGAGGKYALDAKGGAASVMPDVSTGTAKTGISIANAAPKGTAGKATTGISVQTAALSLSTGSAKSGVTVQNTTLNTNTMPSHTHKNPSDTSEGSNTGLNDSGSGTPPDGYATSTATGGSEAHGHGVTDPGHSHTIGSNTHGHNITDNGHTHEVTTTAHGHTLTDGGHAHTVTAKAISTLPPFVALFYIKKL